MKMTKNKNPGTASLTRFVPAVLLLLLRVLVVAFVVVSAVVSAVVFTVAFAVPSASALPDNSKHYEISFITKAGGDDGIGPGQSFEVNHVYVFFSPAPDRINLGNFRLEIESFYSETLASYYFFSHDTKLLVPYESTARVMKFYDQQGSLIKTVDVGRFSKVCGDGTCQQHEHFFMCPEDCQSGGDDGVCDQLADGRCDPDCKAGDYDCIVKKANYRNPFIIGGIIVFFLFILGFIVHIELELNARKKPGYLEAMNFAQQSLNRGYSRDAVRKMLISAGWKPDDAEKLMKKVK